MIFLGLSEGMENRKMSGEKSGNFEVFDKWQPCQVTVVTMYIKPR